jgi:hypothetical protein
MFNPICSDCVNSRFITSLCRLPLIPMAALLLSTTCYAQIFDWTYNIGSQTVPDVTPLPELNNGSGAPLASFLASQPNPAVRVQTPLTPATASTFFNGPTPLSHIFAGFDPANGGDALAALQIENLVFQTAGTLSSAAEIGQFSLDPYHPDASNPSPTAEMTSAAYSFSGVNTASPNLFPGSPTFRSLASGNSSAPNLRSSFFTLPLTRLSEVIEAQSPSHAVIPFVARFNNFGNIFLVNSEFESTPAFETTDQMLSRGDHQALMTHYRMRGIDGVIAHESGIAGYSQTDFLNDTKDGWAFLDNFYPDDIVPITLDTSLDTPTLGTKTFETSGATWSGVIGENFSGELTATVLLSNLADAGVEIRLPTTFDGFDVVERDHVVDSLNHLLLTFQLNEVVGPQAFVWELSNSVNAFVLPGDSHGGIGIGSEIAIPSTVPPTNLLGDFDMDGDIDGADFLKWQRGESLIPLSASELSDWEVGYGTVAPISAASTAVPEPSSVLLLISLAAISVFSRRKTVP